MQLKVDNITAVAYINKMGGTHSIECNEMAKQIWHWAIKRNIWLSAAYIPGENNVVADFHSRCFKENTEWTLSPRVFQSVTQIFFLPQIDLFALAFNCQVQSYVSWVPDTEAYAVDAFSLYWGDLQFYAFPPFSIVARVLAKISRDEATGILIVPRWTTQSWFPQMLTLLIDHPRQIPPSKQLLSLPHNPEVAHPLYKKLSLLAINLSGRQCRVWDYQTKLQTLSQNHGGREHDHNMIPFLEDGEGFALQGKLIPCLPLSLMF